MAKQLNKRFYKTVSVAPEGDGFVVKLDQYTLKTPAKKASDKKTLLLPSERLAELVASEWDGQGDRIDPISMPITRLLNVAIARTPETREELVAEARKYAGTDCLLYTSPSPRDRG